MHRSAQNLQKLAAEAAAEEVLAGVPRFMMSCRFYRVVETVSGEADRESSGKLRDLCESV